MTGPLAGLTVVDLSRYLPGFAATRLLADAGADVVSIRAPGAARRLGPLPLAELDEALNRGKRIESVDLKSEPGRQRLRTLLEDADVLLEGFRPGVMDRLGFGYETLRTRHPRLIYASLTGYGQRGPYSQMAGHDINYLAMSGVLDLIGSAGRGLAIPGIQMADLSAGSQQAVIAILLAVIERGATGKGKFLDISMTAGARWLMQVPAAELARGTPASRGDHALSGRYACYNIYTTRDGRYVAVGALEPAFWAGLCRMLGREDLIGLQYAEDPARTETIQAIQAILKQRAAEEWFAMARHHDACLTPVRTLAEVEADV